ncbi:DUF2917 domain-containing protein [Nitrogeniibacter mangrovi]|uniref:DUF2917 domain-containing protein n=1 Tax=Nitrogeniibacter mangrovi TaxID=2016596 RepID=A0A6C1B8X6_9RHOO|nr:DUF2917 domain-containing protein [Nitrogeniibacter mangrovi]QID19285.1 DUF2917 domain-containing protein [Nitrogeniibacter mangrovi]
MRTATTQTTISLPPHRPLLLKRLAGAQVRVLSGCVWITQYGQAQDILASAGEQVTLPLSSATVLSSAAGARLRLTRATPTPRAGWRRLLGLFDPRWGNAAARDLCRRLPNAPTDAGRA